LDESLTADRRGGDDGEQIASTHIRLDD